jgi:hypothetical protein
MRFRSCHLLALLLGLGACRWESNKPALEEPYEETAPSSTFDAALRNARSAGYVAHEVDEGRRFASFYAHYRHVGFVDGYPTSGILAKNVLMMSVEDDGRVKAWATGPDVAGDKIDKHLAFELSVFVAKVAGYEVELVD